MPLGILYLCFFTWLGSIRTTDTPILPRYALARHIKKRLRSASADLQKKVIGVLTGA
jgi:hypothetical protein